MFPHHLFSNPALSLAAYGMAGMATSSAFHNGSAIGSIYHSLLQHMARGETKNKTRRVGGIVIVRYLWGGFMCGYSAGDYGMLNCGFGTVDGRELRERDE